MLASRLTPDEIRTAAIVDRLRTSSPYTSDGVLDATRLTTGEMMDTLYTALYWATYGGCGWNAHSKLRPELDFFGTFLVDYAWGEPNQLIPEDRLVDAMDALLRLEAAGVGWGSEKARSHLRTALDELQVWAARLP